MCCQPVNANVVLNSVAGDDEYGCSPTSNSNEPFEHISFGELAARGTNKMDMTEITCCEENNIHGQFPRKFHGKVVSVPFQAVHIQ
jgi:uridylate kinase